ncbi:MAG: MOSC domain-containing protein [Candidatus Polarisedimenticolia bacterium]
MKIAAIWRYPVKSMAGEPLRAAELRPDGLLGDRVVHVQDGEGRILTARAHPRLLAHRAALGPDGEPLVDGRPWNDPDVARDVERAAGRGARLVRYEGVERFDVLPLLVATDGAIRAFGRDGRRLRPNLIVGDVPGLAEREWPGRVLQAGRTLIGVATLRARCVMTTWDPDTLEQDHGVLRRIADVFGGRLALDCRVLRGGPVAVGDPVELLEGDQRAFFAS